MKVRGKLTSGFLFLVFTVSVFSQGLNVKLLNISNATIEGERFFDNIGTEADIEKEDLDSRIAYEISFDLKISENFDLGIGAIIGDENIYFLNPKFYLTNGEVNKPYISIKGGLEPTDSVAKNDYIDENYIEDSWEVEYMSPYGSIGIGTIYNNFIFEIAYEYKEVSMLREDTNINDNLKINRIAASIGYNFNLE